jgi:hypothetical protein
MPVARKRPWCICRRWFRPDNRVGSRQRICISPECQALRRRNRQAGWRARNPNYYHGRRIRTPAASKQPPGREQKCYHPHVNNGGDPLAC